ncbi:MAG: hypothetical protein Q8M76_07260, partial [Spirochaetaceae bacterium]|nr:hypothetical protein [Spirochaetaceae bacterium]
AAFVGAVRHVQSDRRFDKNVRQLMHVSFKVAAEIGARYLDAIKSHRESVSKNVTENLFERHLKPLFVGSGR